MQHPEFVESNVAALETPLDEDLLLQIQTILEPIHNQTWPSGLIENN